MTQFTIDQAIQTALRKHQEGQLAEAERIYRQILAQQPNHPGALHLLGLIAYQVGRLDAAIALIRQAIALSPTTVDYHNNLGNVLRDKGSFDDAIAAYCETIRLKSDYPEAHYNLGNTLRAKGLLSEAIAAYRQAIQLRPDAAGARNNLAAALQDEGKWQEALDAYRGAITYDSANASIHWNYARLLALLGHWREAWDEFDWRLKVPSLGLKREFREPQWDGSDSSGKTILLHAEGGFGDALNFIRFVPEIARRGARLILECQKELVPLFQGLSGLDQVIARGEALPAFDWHIPLQGLLRILRVTPENIPNCVPYLSAPPERTQSWAQRLAGEAKLRVGLVWSGTQYASHDHRTRTIDIFAPFAEVPGVKFFSLQKGPDSRQPPPLAMDWTDYTVELNDFADTAALVQNLDLVISVDTSVAHLAGALAKPVWVLIPFQCDCRWMLDRTDTPWYPTMRLFRQTYRGDWGEVIHRMTQVLSEFRSGHEAR